MPRRADEPETASNHIRPNRRTTTAPVRTRPGCDPSSPQCQRVVTAITPQISNRCEKSGLAELRRFEHFWTPKYLSLLKPTPEGRHYSGAGGAGGGVICGGGWAGSSSLSFLSNKPSSGSGSV